MNCGEYHIASFIAYVLPRDCAAVTQRISTLPGVEVHISTDTNADQKGKIVFTVEGEKSQFISRQMDEIRELSEVIMLAPVYHQYLPDESKSTLLPREVNP